ncbi:hypothetical protein Q3G72_022055 [Acer saccharum]|nr:hypothetical protein Q3G72_022055 [Acer saccharum]
MSNSPELNKISWVEVHGVPLYCWCKDFFYKLGGLMGEVLCLDRPTESKQRLDIGRMLVLASLDKPLSCVIDVRVGRRSFPVKLFFDVEESGPARIRVGDREAGSVRYREKKEVRKDFGKPILGSPIVERKEVGGENMVLEKGKGQWCQNVRAAKRQQGGRGDVKIGTQMKQDYRGSSEDTDSSSSGFDSEDGLLRNGLLCRGECSKVGPLGRNVSHGPSQDLRIIGSPVSNIEASSKKGRIWAYKEAAGAKGDKGESGPSVLNRDGSKDKGLSDGENQSSAESRDSSSIQEVPETQMVIEQGIEIVVDLREQEREAVFQKSGAEDMSADVSVDHGPQAEDNRGGLAKLGSEESNPKSVKKKRGKGQFSSIKTHPMKTRGLKSSTECGAKQRKVIWNFKEEIAKVIERGVARRLERETRDKEVSSRTSWSTEEEVANILETGAALGFDFKGQEEEIVEYLSVREREEENRDGL